MKILALEFSSPQRSVAVIDTAAMDSVAEVVATGRAMKPLAMIEEALQQRGWEREQIEGIAIGLGPGSYNGIRVAIALAQGWELGRGVKVTGVGTVDCLAAQAKEEGIGGVIHVVIDAQRNEFYLASYDINRSEPWGIEALRLTSLAEVRARTESGGIVLGPEVTKWFPGARVMFPRAATVARLGSNGGFVPAESVAPIYLRATSFVKAPPPRIIVP
jgi:tRNA threonylcarbamoyl adenosine modification protein YeaZ